MVIVAVKKHITKKGKRYGPYPKGETYYLYEVYRDKETGKVKQRYIGKGPKAVETETPKKSADTRGLKVTREKQELPQKVAQSKALDPIAYHVIKTDENMDPDALLSLVKSMPREERAKIISQLRQEFGGEVISADHEPQFSVGFEQSIQSSPTAAIAIGKSLGYTLPRYAEYKILQKSTRISDYTYDPKTQKGELRAIPRKEKFDEEDIGLRGRFMRIFSSFEGSEPLALKTALQIGSNLLHQCKLDSNQPFQNHLGNLLRKLSPVFMNIGENERVKLTKIVQATLVKALIDFDLKDTASELQNKWNLGPLPKDINDHLNAIKKLNSFSAFWLPRPTEPQRERDEKPSPMSKMLATRVGESR
jgi:hypothetical protein